MSQTPHSSEKPGTAGVDIIEIVDENLRQGFAQVPRPVLRAKGLSVKAKLLYISLLDYAWQTERCFPGQQRLAADLDVSVDSIQRALIELKDFELITWKRTGLNRPNIYYLLRLSDNPRLGLTQPGNRKLRLPETADSGFKKPQQRGDNNKQKNNNQSNNTVVVHLVQHGVSERVAQRLVDEHTPEYLEVKIDLVQWLLETGSPLIRKNPAGYLVKAIREDFTPPSGYETKAERARKQQEHEAREQQIQAVLEVEQEEAEAAFLQMQQQERAALEASAPPKRVRGTKRTTVDIWTQVLERLRGQVSSGNFLTYLAETALVGVQDGVATIVARSAFQQGVLEERWSGVIGRHLGDELGMEVRCRYISIRGGALSADESESAVSP